MPNAHIDAPSLKRLEIDHLALFSLCLRLEQAADIFDGADAADEETGPEIASLARDLKPLLSETQGLEESLLFPDFDRHAGSCFGAMMIERLKAEHRYDRLAAEELSQTLRSLAEARCPLPLATVAAMTRGFVENLRRHVNAEKMMIETLLAAKAEGREIFA